VTKSIDVYAHIGLPRFLSAEDLVRVMDANRIQYSLVSTAQFCPDLRELMRGVRTFPERLRAVGLPLGPSPPAMRDAVCLQMDAGFVGIRILGVTALAQPDLLSAVGERGGFAIVVGFEPWTKFAGVLADFLDRFPNSFIIGGHFAGPTDFRILDSNESMKRLFDNERFYVAFTRQGLMDPNVLKPWADFLIKRLGWSRLVWGSEWPVALWRNEQYSSTRSFIDQFNPTDIEREAFFFGNAWHLLFSKPAPKMKAYSKSLELMQYKVDANISLFPGGFILDEKEHLVLLKSYEAWGGDSRGTYSDFIRLAVMQGAGRV